MKRLVLLCSMAGLALQLSACGDDPETIIDLTVVETLPVDFAAMQAGIVEGAEFELDDLREEPAYADSVTKLRCAGVDAAASQLVVEDLQVGAGATVVDYRVGVRARGAGAYVELARFAGSITEGAEIPLDAAQFTLNAQGLQAVSEAVLSATPALDVQVTASVPGGVDAMQLALELAIDFSSDAKGCPSTTTGL